MGLMEAMIPILESDYPEFMTVARPRKYAFTANYRNPALTAAVLYNSICTIQERDTDATSQHAYWLLHRAVEDYRHPVYFVSSSMMEAAGQTTPPLDLKASDMKWPLPVMTLMIPQDVSVKVLGKEVHFVTIGRMAQGEYRPRQAFLTHRGFDPLYSVTCAGDLIMIYFHARERDDDTVAGYHAHLGVQGSTVGDILQDTSAPLNETDASVNLIPYDLDFEGEFLGRTIRVVLNLLFIITARPDLITTGSLLRKGKVKKNRPVVELWSPNYIGEKYAFNQSQVAPLQGLHTSPRMHWRIGHFRNQRHGQKLAQTKVIWIDPVLVAAPSPSMPAMPG
jgi:hypothetical protein